MSGGGGGGPVALILFDSEGFEVFCYGSSSLNVFISFFDFRNLPFSPTGKQTTRHRIASRQNAKCRPAA